MADDITDTIYELIDDVTPLASENADDIVENVLRVYTDNALFVSRLTLNTMTDRLARALMPYLNSHDIYLLIPYLILELGPEAELEYAVDSYTDRTGHQHPLDTRLIVGVPLPPLPPLPATRRSHRPRALPGTYM